MSDCLEDRPSLIKKYRVSLMASRSNYKFLDFDLKVKMKTVIGK